MDVSVVNVDVQVTDKDGNPVTGLVSDDFEVFEDGDPVAITNFYVVEEGRRVEGSAPPAVSERAAETARPQRSEPAAAATVPEVDRLHLVVFIDNFNLRTQERNRVLDEVMTFVRRTLRREDRVLLATYDRSLDIRHPFTADPFAIEEEIRALRKSIGHQTQRDAERRRAIRSIDNAGTTDSALSAARIYADLVYNEIGFALDGVRELVSLLAGLPGRKAVLHVSSGIPMVVGEDLFYAVERKFNDSSAMSYAPFYDLSRRFEELGRHANANRVSFFTIDAGGLRPVGARVDEQGLRTPGLAVALGSDHQANVQSSLRFLAEETGGRAIVNQNNILPALQEVRTGLRTYYSLGFHPANPGDDRYHRIKVKVARKGVTVRHRAGYTDKNIDTKMREGTMAALYHFHEDDGLGVDVAFGREVERDKGEYVVPLRLSVPISELTLLPTENEVVARLRLYLVVMDDRGRVSDIDAVPLGLRLRREHVESALGERFLHTRRLLTRPGSQRVALGLLDELSGETSFLARALRVGDL